MFFVTHCTKRVERCSTNCISSGSGRTPLKRQSRWWVWNNCCCTAEAARRRAVSVQSQRLIHFNRPSASQPPRIKIARQPAVPLGSRTSCDVNVITRRHVVSSAHGQHTCSHKSSQAYPQCSFLSWMCWQMTLFNTASSVLCSASAAVGHGQVQK